MEKLEPAELVATVISAGIPGIFDGWTSVGSMATLATKSKDPAEPHRRTATAPFRRFICKNKIFGMSDT